MDAVFVASCPVDMSCALRHRDAVSTANTRHDHEAAKDTKIENQGRGGPSIAARTLWCRRFTVSSNPPGPSIARSNASLELTVV